MLFEVVAVALAVLVLGLPVFAFVVVVVGFALASDPPAQANRNLRRTWSAFGTAFLFVPLAVLLQFVAPGVAAPNVEPPIAPHWTIAVVVYAAIVAMPIVIGRTWIRRIAPTRAIGVLTILAGLSVALEFVLLDGISRLLLGAEI